MTKASSIGDSMVVGGADEFAFMSTFFDTFSIIAVASVASLVVGVAVTAARLLLLRTQLKNTRPLASNITIGTTTPAIMAVLALRCDFSCVSRPGFKPAESVKVDPEASVDVGAYECQPDRQGVRVHAMLVVMLGEVH